MAMAAREGRNEVGALDAGDASITAGARGALALIW